MLWVAVVKWVAGTGLVVAFAILIKKLIDNGSPSDTNTTTVTEPILPKVKVDTLSLEELGKWYKVNEAFFSSNPEVVHALLYPRSKAMKNQKGSISDSDFVKLKQTMGITDDSDCVVQAFYDQGKQTIVKARMIIFSSIEINLKHHLDNGKFFENGFIVFTDIKQNKPVKI